MEKIINLSNNPIFKAFVGNRGLRMYKKEVDGRLGMPGLSKLVKEVTGHEPRQDEGYVFAVKNQNVVKMLTRDYRSTNLVELHDERARGIKEEFVKLGLQ